MINARNKPAKQTDFEVKIAEPDYANNSGYLFCQTLRSMLKEGKNSKIDKGRLDKLDLAVTQLEVKMDVEESEREDFLVPEHVDFEIRKYETEVAELKKQIKSLEIEYINEKEKIKIEEDKLAEEVDFVVKKAEVDATESLTQLNTLYQQRATFEGQYERAKDGLTCCSFFPCVAKKEKREIINLAKKLDEVEKKISLLNDAKSVKEAVKDKLDEIKKKEKEEEEKLNSLITAKMPEKKRALIEKLKESELKLETAQGKLDAEIEQFNSQVSKLNMLIYLRTYLDFLGFYQTVDQAYLKKDMSVNKDINTLDHFRNVLVNFKKQIDSYFDRLWCVNPKYNGRHITQSFFKLTEKERSILMTGRADIAFIDKILVSVEKMLALNATSAFVSDKNLFPAVAPTNLTLAATSTAPILTRR